MQNQNAMPSLHPVLIAWMGLLTGALIATLIFAAKLIEASNYQAAMIMSGI